MVSAFNPILAAPQSKVNKKRPITLEEIDTHFEQLFNKKECYKTVRQSSEESVDEISLAAITLVNRNFVKIINSGWQYRALLDREATLSLVREVAQQFEDRIVDTST